MKLGICRNLGRGKVNGSIDEMTDAEKIRLEIRKEVAQELHKQLREAVTSTGRSQSVGVALLAAIFAAAFARGAYGVLLVIPVALGLLIAYQAQLNCDVMVIAWQREQLLEQLRSRLGSDLLANEFLSKSADTGRPTQASLSPISAISYYWTALR